MCSKHRAFVEPTFIRVYREISKICFDTAKAMLLASLLGLLTDKLNMYFSLAIFIGFLFFMGLGVSFTDSVRSWEFENLGDRNE